MGKKVDPKSLIGTRFGPVNVLAPIGRGGMGTVFRARDDLEREVALKLALDPRHRTSGEERFAREGEIAASLDHPGITRVHSAGVENEIPYMICELVEGAQTLDEACAGASLEQRVRWVTQAARAMGHAHERGVVHRDLKPGNLLVGADGQVKVVDFGVAFSRRYDQRLTQTGTAVGTPVYMSPEQLRGKAADVTPASDVWSLGVVLYEALTGVRPFEGENMVELAGAISDGIQLRPRELTPEVSEAVEAVTLAALSVLVEDRHEDGSALADDLEAALAGQAPLHASASGRLNVQGKELGLLVLAGAGAMLVALLALFAILGDPSDRALDAAPSGGDPQVAREEPPEDGVARATRALEQDDLNAARAALDADPRLAARPGADALRGRLLARGLTLAQDPLGGGDALDAVLACLRPLNRVLEPAPDDLARAILARSEALEKTSAYRLGNLRTVTILEGLADSGLTAPALEGRRMVDRMVRVKQRPRHQEFIARCYRYYHACLRLQILLITPEFMALDPDDVGLPPLPVELGPCERYLRLRLDIARGERVADGSSQENLAIRQRAHDALSSLLEKTSPADMGRVTYGNALCFLAIRSEGLRGVRPDAIYARALSYTPDNLFLLSAYASFALGSAVNDSKRGRRDRARERILEARKITAQGIRLASQGYEDEEAFGWTCQELRRLAVRSNALVGDEDAAQAIIDSTPEHPWIEHGGFRDQLREELERSLSIYERVFAR